MSKTKAKPSIMFPSRSFQKWIRMSRFIKEMPATFKVLQEKTGHSSSTVQKYLDELLKYRIIVKDHNLYRFNDSLVKMNLIGTEYEYKGQKARFTYKDIILLTLYMRLPLKFVIKRKLGKEDVIEGSISEVLGKTE